MKEQFLNYLKKELAGKQSLLLKNTLSDEEREFVNAAVASLQETIEAVDAMSDVDNNEAIEALRETCENLNQGVRAIQEKLAQREQTITTEMENKYLSSKNSVHDFAEAIRNSRNSSDFRRNWNDMLVKNGITIAEGSEDAYLPDSVKGRITDVWEKNADWLRDLNDTGAKRFYVRHNTSDKDAETSRAKGHKAGTDKVSQSIALSAKLLEAQYIYKIQELSYQTIWNSDQELIDYVISELVGQVLYEIKRAVLVGDGRANDSDYKINSFEAVAKDTTDAYTTVFTAESDFLIDDVRKAVDSIHNENGKPIYVFMSKDDVRTMSRIVASDSSTPVYIGIDDLASQIGCDRIITTDLLGDDYKMIAMIPQEYYLVGANILDPVLYSWHEGYTNTDVWRYECVAGGGLNGLKSSAVLLPGE